MKHTKRSLRLAAAAVVSGALGAMAPAVTDAAVPTMMQDDGAYARLPGSPADGTAKFRSAWSASTPASAAAGYGPATNISEIEFPFTVTNSTV